jgi:beta-lactamase regulating signal transducer with metallopeptidase domain
LPPSRDDVLDEQPLDSPVAVQATVAERSNAAIHGAWPRSDQDLQAFSAAPVSVPDQPGQAPSGDGQELVSANATESALSVIAIEAKAQPIHQDDRSAGGESIAYSPARQMTYEPSPSVGDAPGRAAVIEEPASGVQHEQGGQRSARFAALLPKLAFGIWLAGVGFCGLVSVLSYLLLLWSLRRCRPAPSRWARELSRLRREVGFKRKVCLETHPRLGPFVCWTPRGTRVVVPVPLWSRLAAAERLAVLHHELCHLRRGDLWKSLLAHAVVHVHWFNPWAWLAARCFDESAEWMCDAMMIQEAPSRAAPLAKALLAAARRADTTSCGALAVSGGTVVRRIRRLLEVTDGRDRTMRKIYWIVVLITATLLSFVRPQHIMLGNSSQALGQTAAATETFAQAKESRATAPGDESEASSPTTSESEGQGLNEPENPKRDSAVSSSEDVLGGSRLQERLDDLAERIVIGQSEVLARFVKVLKTEAGRVVIADRMALVEQNAARQQAASTSWETFLATRFQESDNGLKVRPEYAQEMDRYVRTVERGTEAVQLMVPVFQEVAEALVSESEAAGLLKRFLLHEAACAAVYYHELRSNLHPSLREIEGQLEDLIVRTAAGHYVIRPARRVEIAQQLSQLEKRSSLLDDLHQELCAWAGEMVDNDPPSKRVEQMLRSRPFAAFLAFQSVPDRSNFTSDDLEGIFALLEEATDDTASGLKLNPDSDAARSLLEYVDRFSAMWEQREILRESLAQLLDLIEERDELHRRLKSLMQSEDAFVALAVSIDYAGRSAADAAREWLSNRVTKNDMGRYELTVESPDQLIEELRNYFSEFREIRRRGRSIDVLAARLEDQTLKNAMQSYLGKLLLRDLVEQAAVTADLDPLQLWIEEHFEEQAQGLVLREGAEGAIADVIEQAEQLEAQLKQVDF